MTAKGAKRGKHPQRSLELKVTASTRSCIPHKTTGRPCGRTRAYRMRRSRRKGWIYILVVESYPLVVSPWGSEACAPWLSGNLCGVHRCHNTLLVRLTRGGRHVSESQACTATDIRSGSRVASRAVRRSSAPYLIRASCSQHRYPHLPHSPTERAVPSSFSGHRDDHGGRLPPDPRAIRDSLLARGCDGNTASEVETAHSSNRGVHRLGLSRSPIPADGDLIIKVRPEGCWPCTIAGPIRDLAVDASASLP